MDSQSDQSQWDGTERREDHKELKRLKRQRLYLTFGRYLLIVAISVSISLFLAGLRIRDGEVNGCERRQLIFNVIEDILLQTANNLDRRDERSERITPELVQQFRNYQQTVSENIVEDCDEAYPPVIPWID